MYAISETDFSVILVSYKWVLNIVVNVFCIGLRKLGESEAQCNTLREEVKQLKAEIEQLKVGGRSAGMFDVTPNSQNLHYK